MAKKLTQQEFEIKVFNCVGNKYTVISEYLGKTKPITLHCNIHNINFTVNAECFMRGPKDIRCKCPKCSEEQSQKQKLDIRTKVKCAYCGKEFLRLNSKLNNSKSGLYFCSRECKDTAQSLKSGDNFKSLRPEHYGSLFGDYRKLAFKNYPHKCAVCGYDEDERILQVHHKDENREHNNLENLIILCPNCHWKITLHLYTLTKDNILLPI